MTGCIVKNINLILVLYTVSAQCRLHLSGRSELFYASSIVNFIFHYSLYVGTCPFCNLISSYDFLCPFVVFIVWMAHVHVLKFTINLVIWAPPSIVAISKNLVLWFIYARVFKFHKYLYKTLVLFPYFSVITSLGCFSSSSLYCFKYRSFVFI